MRLHHVCSPIINPEVKVQHGWDHTGVSISRLSPACLVAALARRYFLLSCRFGLWQSTETGSNMMFLHSRGNTEAAFLLRLSRCAALLSLLYFDNALCGFIKFPGGVEVTIRSCQS